MGDCCSRSGYETTFGDRFARHLARRYRKRGLDRTRRRLVGFLGDHGIDGASVLEIGGGVGEIQVELLRRGATRATNLELSTSYEDEAARLIDGAGMTGRVTRRFVDIATEQADIVVLHRVVCCYPDHERLLAAAGSHARRLLVFSHPPRNATSRFLMWGENLLFRLRGSDFRAFVHPPDAMVAVLQQQGLTVRYRHRSSLSWCVVGLER
jgi:magnesium-protoporphyrin O-methyltransferase